MTYKLLLLALTAGVALLAASQILAGNYFALLAGVIALRSLYNLQKRNRSNE